MLAGDLELCVTWGSRPLGAGACLYKIPALVKLAIGIVGDSLFMDTLRLPDIESHQFGPGVVTCRFVRPRTIDGHSLRREATIFSDLKRLHGTGD